MRCSPEKSPRPSANVVQAARIATRPWEAPICRRSQLHGGCPLRPEPSRLRPLPLITLRVSLQIRVCAGAAIGSASTTACPPCFVACFHHPVSKYGVVHNCSSSSRGSLQGQQAGGSGAAAAAGAAVHRPPRRLPPLAAPARPAATTQQQWQCRGSTACSGSCCRRCDHLGRLMCRK